MNDNAGIWQPAAFSVDTYVDGEIVPFPVVGLRRGPFGVFCEQYNASPANWPRVSVAHVASGLRICGVESGARAYEIADALLQWESAFGANYKQELMPLRQKIRALVVSLGGYMNYNPTSPKSVPRSA